MTVQIRTEHILCFLGIDPTHNGYRQLLDCILVQAEQHFPDIGSVYSVVAKKYNIQPKSVLRNISYALSKVDDLPEKLSLLLGFPINNAVIHNGSVINYIAVVSSEPDLYNISA